MSQNPSDQHQGARQPDPSRNPPDGFPFDPTQDPPGRTRQKIPESTQPSVRRRTRRNALTAILRSKIPATSGARKAKAIIPGARSLRGHPVRSAYQVVCLPGTFLTRVPVLCVWRVCLMIW